MSNQIVPLDHTKLPAEIAALFNPELQKEDMTTGLSGGYAVVAPDGGRFFIKYGGEKILMEDSKTGDPVTTFYAVILKARMNISRKFHMKAYEAGDKEAPDCMSMDGVKPDAGVPNPQSTTCAACKNSQWGSRVTPAGKKAKACQEHRRVAVVPALDMENERFGGPMLLRVPPDSLQNLAAFNRKCTQQGWGYNALIVRIGFDTTVSHVKLTFQPAQHLTPQIIAKYLAPHYMEGKVDRILETVDDNELDRDDEEGEAAPAPAQAAPQPAQAPEPDDGMTGMPDQVGGGEAVLEGELLASDPDGPVSEPAESDEVTKLKAQLAAAEKAKADAEAAAAAAAKPKRTRKKAAPKGNGADTQAQASAATTTPAASTDDDDGLGDILSELKDS